MIPDAQRFLTKNHVRYCWRNQVCASRTATTVRDSVLVFKGFVSQSGHERTKGTSMDHTQPARGYYARRLRAKGATTAALKLINYHCHSFIAIRDTSRTCARHCTV